MLKKALIDFFESYENLRSALRNFDPAKEGVEENEIRMLKDLVFLRVCTLRAFELLLRRAPGEAMEVMKNRYLSQDLSHHAHDPVADLEVMFDDVKEILGEAEFENLLNCPEFLDENKNNPRVRVAISFVHEK
jgi:hypothetical protein